MNAPREHADAAWWSDAVGYEVYLRSFADGDGDGLGDLTGLVDRLDHLADLGVDVVWVTPFYPSPMADFGYDVADHRDVDPRFGTLDDVERLTRRAHDLGLRVIIDLVPNHTSSEHRWFRSALTGPESPERGLYLWRDPAPDGGPPNNWLSHFGGPAWTLDEASGQYWCHLFLPEQPDLDWSNERVREEFRDILGFWLDRGVDGFRIDVAHSLVKHPELPDNPVGDTTPAGAGPMETFWAMRHDHDLDQPDVVDIYRDWRAITAPRDAVLLGEVYLGAAPAVGRYVADDDGLDVAFYFPVLHTAWDPVQLRTVVADALDHGHGRFAWVHSSHDESRAASRFGGGDQGRTRALGFTAFTAFLPGPLFLYQGDELGLVDGEVHPDHAADPVAVRNTGGSAEGRDPSRTPMPWAPDEPNLGFSTGEPWLPVAPNHGPADTVVAQRRTPGSPLQRMQELLRVRRDLRHRCQHPVTWVDGPADVLAYRRGPLLVALNAGTRPATLAVDGGATLAFGHGGADLGPDLELPPDAVGVVVSDPPAGGPR